MTTNTSNATNLHVILGTGPVGMAIMDELHARGLRIRMVNRSGKTYEALPDGVELLSGDASNKDFARNAAEGATHVYNALNPPYSKWVEAFPGLQAASIAAAEATNARLIVMDNLYMYGDTGGQPMSEQTPMQPNSKKGRLRASMARDLMQAHEAGRVQVVVGRAADFIGPRVMQSTLGGERVLENIVVGKPASVIGNLDHPHSYTYMPDIGRALVELAHTDDAYGQVWHLPTPPAITPREYLQRLYAEAGHPMRVQVAPKLVLRLIGIFNPDVGEVVEMLYQFDAPFIVDDSKFTARFGWGATDIDSIVTQTVNWFRRVPE
jgi:nucleoside-diphosphate-sugar epimerase